jgi:YD repeat-containing protein
MYLRAWKPILILAFLLVCSLTRSIPTKAQSWPNGYSERRIITIDHTKVPNSDQSAFPVLISGTYSDLATTSNGGSVTSTSGYDIIFTSDSAGSTTLPFEQESYAPSTGHINYWVQVPTLSHSSDTLIYMFYGNSSVSTDQSNKNGTWDSNYQGVWHLPNGTTLTANDSTSNPGNGTLNNSPSAATGQIDGAASFGGSNYVTVNKQYGLTTAVTLSAWVEFSNLSGWQDILGQNTSSWGGGNAAFYFQKVVNGGDGCSRGSNVLGILFPTNNSECSSGVYSSTAVSTGTWYYVVATYDGSTVSLYINGSLSGTNSRSGSIGVQTGNLNIGSGYYAGSVTDYLNGVVDEVRVSSSARSADWISTEYNNQSSPATFYSMGSGLTSTQPTITSLSSYSGYAGSTVTVTGTNYGSTQGSSTVAFNGTLASVTTWGSTSVVVTVPAGATTGNVIVTVSGVASNGVSFTALSPAITSVSTTSGPPGIPTTITGTNFGSSQGSSTVTFNGTAATVTSWSATSIAVTVPTGATTGNVVVTVSGNASNGTTFTVTAGPGIFSLSPTSGIVGSWVTISGVNFGSSQNTSTISFNGTNASVVSWSSSSIVGVVPSGASSGSVVITVSSQPSNGAAFTITTIPSGWSDVDIGSVGMGGSASYSNGTFTVEGSGASISGTSDQMNFLYQSLSGDGTIIARLVSLSGGSSSEQAGVMIRETLNANATHTFPAYQASELNFNYRASTGGGSSYQGNPSVTLPYWLKVVRSSNTFTGYYSTDGVNWTQLGTSQTISMASGVYVGLGVSSDNNSNLATATFDHVSVSSSSSSAPSITSVSPAAGVIGSQSVIFGSGFGTSQNGSVVLLGSTAVTINSWSGTSIQFTVPTGASSGMLTVLVATSMNASNPFGFLVGTEPLSGWLDVDIGSIGMTGSASYSGGTFTVEGSGQGISSTADQMNFLYQPLSGDGTIIARLVSLSGGSSSEQAGVMIRETLNANSTHTFPAYQSSELNFNYRASTGGGSSYQGNPSVTLPYWLKVVRSSNTFTGYYSTDGVNWTQLGTSQTISMASGVYVGLGVSSDDNSDLATATFDHVSVTSSFAPTISSISPTSGVSGASITIAGTGFGVARGGSVVQFNGSVAAISNWSDTSISAVVPNPVTSGPVIVTVNGENSNGESFTALTTGTLSGTVTSTASGSPAINGANITVTQVGEIKATATSNSSGDYSISSLPTGPYDVTVSASGYGTSLNSAVTVSPNVTTTLNASLSLAGTISGTVTKSDGVTPISGATVVAMVGNASATPVTTNSSGNYSISGLSAASYTVEAFANGYVASSQSESVTASSTTTANFSLQTQGTGTIAYVYDMVGRLAGVISPSGDTAIYNYDAVGNLLSIQRQSSSQISVITVTPASGPAGSSITIYGTGFSTTTTQDTVEFNGTAATVQSATATKLVVTVPVGATTGPITVTTTAGTATSNRAFIVVNQ